MIDAKPNDELRGKLRGRGFLWAPSVGAWQRKATPDAWRAARDVVASATAGNNLEVGR